MLLIFRGDPAELASGGALSRQSITLEGVAFPMNVAVDASGLSDKLKAKLRNNRHFEIVEEPAAPAEANAQKAPPPVDDDAEEAAAAAAHAERAASRRKKAAP